MLYSIKKLVLVMGILIFSLFGISYADGAGNSSSTFTNNNALQYLPGEVLVKFKDIQTIASRKSILNNRLGEMNFESRDYNSILVAHIKSNTLSTQNIIDRLSKDPSVEAVSPNYIRQLDAATNDTHYTSLWGMNNTGQSGGTPDADIDAQEAWDLQSGSKSVVVAVVDTGVDYSHDDLSGNMWDGSALGIPHHGWDFAADSSGNDDDDPMPGHDHGTHVAGTIGATANNNLGVVGVSQHVSLMAIKVFRPNGYGYDSDISQGMDFISDMIDQGVNVVAINASYGGSGYSSVMRSTIADLGNKGVVFCAAAGNGGSDGVGDDNDADPHYPSNYDLDNIISVAATDRSDNLAGFSNYGSTSVDISAPGVAIMSTLSNNGYASWNGTSMATPHVAGAVALLAANSPNASVSERINTLYTTVDPLSSLTGKVSTGGRLNIHKALVEDNSGGGTNTKPIADAGANQNAQTSDTVGLDGSGSSDAESDPLTYQWQFVSRPAGSGAALSSNTSVNPTFEADVAGEYVVELIVNDGTVDSDPSQVTITVADGSSTDVTTWTSGSYGRGVDISKELSISGAESLSVTIIGETTPYRDFLYIYDENGVQIEKLSGHINKTVTVQGDTITARLTSNRWFGGGAGVTVTIAEN